MSRILPNEYFATQERLCEWFESLKRAVGCSENADLGAVLRKAEAMGRKIEAYEEQQAIVARHYNYEGWGYLLRTAMNGAEEEAVVVELPRECLKVPKDWCYGDGKPDYGKAKKYLPTTQKLMRKGLGHIEELRPKNGDEWADDSRSNLIKAFVESGSPQEIEKEIWRFINGVEDETDPSEVWITAADESRATLEASGYLPPTAVDELLDYADMAGVEITQAQATGYEESEFAGARWFYYLLCAYLMKEQRPDKELVFEVGKEARIAAGLGKLFDSEAGGLLRAGVREGEWDPTATLADLETAYLAYKETLGKVDKWATTDEIAEVILTALGRQAVEN